MSGVVQFVRSLFFLAMLLGALGTLGEAKGCLGREAVMAHQNGGISFRCLNDQLNDSKLPTHKRQKSK